MSGEAVGRRGAATALAVSIVLATAACTSAVSGTPQAAARSGSPSSSAATFPAGAPSAVSGSGSSAAPGSAPSGSEPSSEPTIFARPPAPPHGLTCPDAHAVAAAGGLGALASSPESSSGALVCAYQSSGVFQSVDIFGVGGGHAEFVALKSELMRLGVGTGKAVSVEDEAFQLTLPSQGSEHVSELLVRKNAAVVLVALLGNTTSLKAETAIAKLVLG